VLGINVARARTSRFASVVHICWLPQPHPATAATTATAATAATAAATATTVTAATAAALTSKSTAVTVAGSAGAERCHYWVCAPQTLWGASQVYGGWAPHRATPPHRQR
jgi:hypothetical protein